MHQDSRPWYFPLLFLLGNVFLLVIVLSGCGSATTPCTSSPTCSKGRNQQNGSNQNTDTTNQGGTITETPISKTALRSYVIISSSDSIDSGRIVPDGSHLSIQLTPQGRLANGKSGKMLAFTRTVNQKDIGLENIPPGVYLMHITGIDPGGKQLRVCLSYNDDEPAPTQHLALQHGLLGIEGQSATTVQLMICPT